MSGDEITAEGRKLADRWESAKKRLEHAKGEVNSAECEVANSTTAFGKWLLPKDARKGDKIAVWIGPVLYQAEVVEGDRDPVVTVRQRGVKGSRP